MKATFLILPILLTSFIFSCGGNDIQVTDTPITGSIAGEQWDLRYANAFTNPNLIYTVRFLSTLETATSPCSVPSPGNPFLSMAIPLQRASYSVPFTDRLDDSPRFHVDSGNSFIATSGFVEIVEISNTRIFGLLQAQFDDGNTVEGSFEVIICD